MTTKETKTQYLEAECFDEVGELQTLIHEVTQLGDDSSQVVVPKHGFCVKTRDETSTKIFLNFCHCPEMPSPETLSEDELKLVLESEDPTTYRIPMSLGEPHKEADKGGQTCLAYDIIVSSDFFERIEGSELFKVFLITVGIQGLEDKYNITLNKEDWLILKNKRYHGVMPTHCIRKAPKVAEISGSPVVQKDRHKQQDPPDWVLLRPNGGPNLEARFLLDKVAAEEMKSYVQLELNDERLVLRTSSHYGTVDVDLPNKVRTKDCKAIFRKHAKVLQVKMPIYEEKLIML